MKRTVCLLLALVLVLSLAGCGMKKERVDQLAGAWMEKNEPLTEETEAVFAAAMESYSDMELEAVSLLGTQVVAGLNYRFLCNVRENGTVVGQKVVTVYRDLEQNCTVTAVNDPA